MAGQIRQLISTLLAGNQKDLVATKETGECLRTVRTMLLRRLPKVACYHNFDFAK